MNFEAGSLDQLGIDECSYSFNGAAGASAVGMQHRGLGWLFFYRRATPFAPPGLRAFAACSIYPGAHGRRAFDLVNVGLTMKLL